MVDVIGGGRATASPCGDIQEFAAALAAMSGDDPTRVAAQAHAEGCRACAEALAEGATVIAWVDSALAEAAAAGTPDSEPVAPRHAPGA